MIVQSSNSTRVLIKSPESNKVKAFNSREQTKSTKSGKMTITRSLLNRDITVEYKDLPRNCLGYLEANVRAAITAFGLTIMQRKEL